ncbi:hypothetical protein BDV37DRAFT_266657, partial [Aspergillus pseudonomiae]
MYRRNMTLWLLLQLSPWPLFSGRLLWILIPVSKGVQTSLFRLIESGQPNAAML